MEAKFKIGDKVKILPRDLLKYRSGYTDSMTRYIGKIATICMCACDDTNPVLYDDDGYIYKIDIDERIHLWNSSMLTPLEETLSTPIGKILSQRFTNKKKIYKLNWKV